MNKKLYLLIFQAIILISFVKAEVSSNEPYYSVGSDFLIMNNNYDSKIQVLFDNTNIFLDNNNDGIWDYRFFGNGGELINIEPEWRVSPGSRIYSDKPVYYKQELYYLWNPPSYRNFNTIVPPISSFKSEYLIFNEDYAQNWRIISEKNITVYVDVNNDGSIEETLNIEKGKEKRFSIPQNTFARVYSEDNQTFLTYCEYYLVAPMGTDFYIPMGSIKIVSPEDNTEIKIDHNNDLAYDETVILNKEQRGFSLTQGTHISSDKPISVFLNFVTFNSPGIMPSSINNDIWGECYWDFNNKNFILGLFNNASGFSEKTNFFMDLMSENDLNPDYSNNISSNSRLQAPNKNPSHTWANMPLISYMHESYQYILRITPSYAYSRIYPVTYPTNKYVKTGEDLTVLARVFNPFAKTNATDFNVKLRFNNLFSAPAGFNVYIKKKHLNTDATIDSDIITKNPFLVDSQYEFTIDNTDSDILSELGGVQYFEIEYEIISPLDYGLYDFEPVEISYNAPTWNMPK